MAVFSLPPPLLISQHNPVFLRRSTNPISPFAATPMSSPTHIPLPSTQHYIHAVRKSCFDASTSLGLTPNIHAVDSFLRALDQSTFERLRIQHPLSFPLRFPTATAELNFLAILALLNAFSAYRTTFHKATALGVYHNVVRLMLALYISGSRDAEDSVVGSSALTSNGMCRLTHANVVELLGVSVYQQNPHPSLPGVTVGVRRGEMLDAVHLIHSTIQDVGNILVAKAVPSLGAYLVHLLQQTKQKRLDDVQATDYLVRHIAQTFPQFTDSHTLPNTQAHPDANQDVYLFKPIFFLLHSIRLRFAHRDDWMVPNTIQTLPMFVDNVLPTLCVWFNFFNLPHTPVSGMHTLFEWVNTAHCNAHLPRSKLQHLQNNLAGPSLTAHETYAIRAATLNIGQAVVQRAKQLANQHESLAWLHALNEVDLHAYLCAVANQDQQLTKLPRLVFPSIHF